MQKKKKNKPKTKQLNGTKELKARWSFCTDNHPAEVWMITQLSVLLLRSIYLSGKVG